MQYTRFEIKHFKGIEHAIIDLEKLPQTNILSLVGLNESGKTTLLEAINSFSAQREEFATLYRDYSFKSLKYNDLIPKHLTANFNGIISITAKLSLNDKDRAEIATFVQTQLNYRCDIDKFKTLTIVRKHTYSSSKYVRSNNEWDFSLPITEPGKRKLGHVWNDSVAWGRFVDFVSAMLPQITYFPTFLFNFPDRIYLSNPLQIRPSIPTTVK